MKLSCLFGHKWNGCKCVKCGEVRDENHAWNYCTCSKCGKKREGPHLYEYRYKNARICEGTCKVCGEIKEESHAWDKCRCTKCKGGRDRYHDWQGCKCKVCGKVRDEEHSFRYESKDKDTCVKTCFRCGKKMEVPHEWDGCTCKNCHMTVHDFQPVPDSCKEKCTKCQEITQGEHVYVSVEGECCKVCKYCGKKDYDYHHTWEPVEGECIEKCSVCGQTRENHHYEDGTCTVCGQDSPDKVMDKCLAQLLSIFPSTPLDYEGHKRFDAAHRSEVRAIGEKLDKLGGMRAMRKVGEAFARELPIHARKLETTWDGIGYWMG